MRRRVQKVYKKLPPHTYEAHPLTNAGEASKPLIIGIIAIVAVIALSLLLLFSDQLVGKAYGGPLNSAGADLNSVKAYTNQQFSFNVSANIGPSKSTKSIAFELQLPPGITCSQVTVTSLLTGWTNYVPNPCDSSNKISFFYATTDQSLFKTGVIDAAKITLSSTAKKEEGYLFDLKSFAVFDSQQASTNLIDQNNINDITVNVIDPVCGDSDVNQMSEQCDDGNTANGDGCSAACQTEVAPAVCGNGVKEGTEECDLGKDNGGITKTCSSTCKTWLSCTPNNANGVVMTTTAGEQTFEAKCNPLDFTLRVVVNCQANPVSYTLANVKCSSGNVCKLDENKVAMCVSLTCGNGKVEAGETCDDGNTANGDGCSAACQKEEALPPPLPPVPGEVPPTEFQCVTPPSGLVSWWAGEDNAYDLQAKNAGQLKGGLSFTSGKVGKAFQFDGVDDYVEIPDSPSQTPAAMTLMAWIKWKKGTTIISKWDSFLSQASWYLLVNGDELRFLVGGTGGQASEIDTDNVNLVVDQWYHVVAVYDSANKLMKIYVNGVEVPSTVTPNSAFVSPFDGTAPVRIGASVGSGGVAFNPFNGLIDEVAFWNKALTAQEIKSIYDADTAGMCRPALAVCDDTHPTSCTTQMTCTSANNYWSNNACYDACIAGTEDPNNDNVCTPVALPPPPPPVPEEVPQYQCTETVPSDSVLCLDDDKGLSQNTARTLVQSCTMQTKCEYACNQGYHFENGACVPVQPQYQCTGTPPSYAQLCSGDNTGLSQNTAVKAVSQCSDPMKCEYQCDSGYAPNAQGTNCEAAVTVQGTKVTLTDVPTANNVFSTKITATETFTQEITIYTLLYDVNGKVLALKLEKVAGLTKDQTYTAALNYPEANVKRKSVILYDVKQNPAVFGSLEVGKS